MLKGWKGRESEHGIFTIHLFEFLGLGRFSGAGGRGPERRGGIGESLQTVQKGCCLYNGRRSPGGDRERNQRGRGGGRESSDCALLAAEYIVNHYETPITVEGLAAYASVSHSSLYRRFMKRFQMSPKRFLLEYRIERACALLASTGHSIQEISNSVGFEDPFYFSRAFKDVKGVSPRQYANQARSGREAAMGEDEVKSPSMI